MVLALALSLVTLAAPVQHDATAPRPNIVLITLDTTRADHLGCYGWRHASTPKLDRLAARGARFQNCETSAPLTLPSHATILTGLWPPRHGVRDNGMALSPVVSGSIAELLAARGYDAGAVVSAAVLSRSYGLNRGFRVYDDDLGRGYSAGTMIAERPAEQTTSAALSVLAGMHPPFFMWVHYFDPHEEYRPPPRYADALGGPTRLYDGEIAYMDAEIGRLLEAVPAGSVIAAVGDHGEMLGEHGERSHGLLPFLAARRVPLILSGPGIAPGKVVDCAVSTADVLPTLLELAGLSPSGTADGKSLVSLVEGTEGCGRVSYCEAFLPYFSYRWYPIRVVRDDRWVYVQGPRAGSLFDGRRDPDENHDLAVEEPAQANRLQERLVELLGQVGEAITGDAPENEGAGVAARGLLRSLGYLGGVGGGRIDGELPDPRTMAPVHDRLETLAEAVRHGGCAAAVSELEAIARKEPHNVPVRNLLGTCETRLGRPEKALAAFQSVSAMAPGDPLSVGNVANSLVQLGRVAEAEAAYREALRLDPAAGEIAGRLAQLLRSRGARSEALEVLESALGHGGRHPQLFFERGMALVASGRGVEAEADFREAARRDPANPAPLEMAAGIRLARHDYNEAARWLERCVALQPSRLDLWKVLGQVYLDRLKQPEQALRCFRTALRLETDPRGRQELQALVARLTR